MDNYSNIRGQTCPNKECVFYEIKVPNKVVIHSREENRFQCSQCKKTWVGRKDSPTYRLRYTEDEIKLALLLLENGISVRKIAKKVGVSPSTIQRWKSVL